MRIDTLSPAAGATRATKRLGRGIGSGTGKTSGKGHKGQWARSGGGVRPGFEGGQMPIARRVPKRGFTHNGKKVYVIVNLSDLAELESDVSWRHKLGQSQHALLFTQFSCFIALGQHVLSPPYLFAPQPLHFSRQLGVVASA